MPAAGTTYTAIPGTVPVPSYTDPTQNPAAYGSIPNIPMPTATPPTVTGVRAGQTVNAQLPGYTTSLGNVGGNIQAETAGQLPPDVVRQIEQTAAERGIATGSPGSPNANASLLAALGLNSLQLTGMGQNNLQSILGSLPGASLVANPSFYPSVGQTQEAQQLRATYAAAPKPQAAANAARAAALQGLAAGRSSVPTTSVPSAPGYTWGAPPTGFTTPAPLVSVSGSGVNPGGLPLNTTGMNENEIDQIIGAIPGAGNITGAASPGYSYFGQNTPEAGMAETPLPTEEEAIAQMGGDFG
jgi:hypothetical protein